MSIAHGLALGGQVLSVAWIPPDGMTEAEWREAGAVLGKVERAVGWWIGDWWKAYKPEWGDRGTVATSDEWKAAGLPDYGACRNSAAVCDAFDIARRRAKLSFTHHTEVAPLPPADADALLDRAKAERLSTRELRALVRRIRNAAAIGAQQEDIGSTAGSLAELVAAGRRFGCIYADPPWLYDNQGTRAATGNHYGGLTVDELCALPIINLAADNAHLHLWTTNAFLFECPRIFEAWGFEFRSTFVWCKTQMGIGNYWRNSHEILLTAIRGDAKRFNDHSMMSWMECDRGAHSAKPEQVRAMLERASPGPNLELFARLPADRWTAWGAQVEDNLFRPGEAA